MSEFRKDPVTNRWIVIAPELFEEVQIHHGERSSIAPLFCPFCAGNESCTPKEVLAYGPPGRKPNGPDWSVRVFPSRYPILQTEGSVNRQGKGMYDFMNGLGAHEVLVHSPHHNPPLPLGLAQAELVLRAYRDRIMDLFGDKRLHYVMIFSDYGRSAGEKISHPHSQIVALPKVPERIREELRGCRDYFKLKERCVFCDMIRQERSQGARIIAENDGYVAFCPFASRSPYEVWILPRKHRLDFEGQTDAELARLALLIQSVASKISVVLDEPEYHFVLHTGPNLDPRPGYWDTVREDYHWHIEIVPRYLTLAGFEWEFGFHVNPITPERAAQALRALHIGQ